MSAAEHVAIAPALRSLPLAALYLTDRCNSRCVTCDYWRHGRTNLTLAALEPMLPSLRALGTRVVLLSGGEPLLNPEWQTIAARLRENDLRLWLLTSGLSLAKHAAPAARLFDAITVSLDGTVAATYAAIRGLDAFDKVCDGIRAAAALGVPVSLRVTVQRANFRELPRFVTLARELGASQVSFLAVDVGNAHAFARTGPVAGGLALDPQDLAALDELLDGLERESAAEFDSHFIAESPAKLRRLRAYFAALNGQGPFPAVRCNAPEFSAVIAADGRVQPCFFIPGPAQARSADGPEQQLNAAEMRELRAAIRAGERRECQRCVCSMWRDPETRQLPDFLPAAHGARA